jgi:hypothetical protein
VIQAERYKRECLQARRKLPEYLPRVHEFILRQQKSGGHYHLFSEYKALELWQYLLRLAPSHILELGSGATTSVMAEYVSLRKDVTLVSVDQDENYLNRTRQGLDPAVRDNVHFELCKRMVREIGGLEVCYYDPKSLMRFPENRIDLVYVDGPANKSPTRAGRLMPCIDSVRILQAGHLVKYFLFDYRISSVLYFCDSFFSQYYHKDLHHQVLREQGEPWLIGPVRHHSFLSRICAPGVEQGRHG